MRDYDDDLYHAKQDALRALLDLNNPKATGSVDRMATAMDGLNKAWDELTDCLLRRIDERDEQIKKLINELAEAKKGK